MSYSRVERNRRSIYKIFDYLLENKNTVSVLVPSLFSFLTLIFFLTNLLGDYSVIFSILGLLWGLYVVKKVKGVDAWIYSVSMLICLGVFIFVRFSSPNSGFTKLIPHKNNVVKVKNTKKANKETKTKQTSEEKDRFSKSYYDSLVVGDENGVGGVEYSVVESQVGSPTAVSEEVLGDTIDPYVTHTIRTATWSNGVSLKFELQEDGYYLLKEKEGM